MRTAEHPRKLRGCLRARAEAESREDHDCSGCALARPDGRFACLRLCDELIGGSGLEPRADLLGGPPLRPRADGSYCGWAPAPLPRRPALQLRPASSPARLGPALVSERRCRCRLGRSQGHEEAAAATAARVKVTGRDCGGGGSDKSGR